MMSATIITGKEPEKVSRAESMLTVMEDACTIDKFYKTEKQTTVEWRFQQSGDADYAARIFMNNIGFEYVQKI